MKQVVSILLLLIFAKPAISQNEDLIREVERHILWVDSLIVYDRNNLVWFNESFVSIDGRGGGGGVTYWTGDNPTFRTPRIECDLEWEKEMEKFNRTIILNHTSRVGGENNSISQKKYYKNGELVAIIIQEWTRGRDGRFQNDRFSRITIFINDNQIIFSQREGRVRNWRRVKAEIKERYNLR